MTDNFWPELTNTVGRIAASNPPAFVTWALTSALDTLERLHDAGRLSADYQAMASTWFATVETRGLVAAMPFPLLASDESASRGDRIAASLAVSPESQTA